MRKTAAADKLRHKKERLKEMLDSISFSRMDAVGVIHARSHRKIRLREIFLTQPQTSCGIERKA